MHFDRARFSNDICIPFASTTKQTKVRRRGLLVASRKRTCLLEVETCELQAGQSKAHLFEVGPYSSGGGSSSSGSDGRRQSECSLSTNGRGNDEESPGVPKVCNGCVTVRRRAQPLRLKRGTILTRAYDGPESYVSP